MFPLSKILISLLTIIITILAVEIFFKFYISRQTPIIFEMVKEDNIYQLDPGFEGEFSGISVKINKQGFRQNKDVGIKEPNTKRIVGIGDSVTFGFGVNEEETYLRQLENILRDNQKNVYEVINLAVSGYNSFQERIFLEKQISQVQPDVLVVGLVLNDIGGDFHVPNYVYRNLIPFKPGAYSINELDSKEKFFYNLFKKSYLYQFMHQKLAYLWGFRKPEVSKVDSTYAQSTLDFYENGSYPEMKYRNALLKTEKELSLITNKGMENNFKTIVVIFPVEIQVRDKKFRKPQALLKEFCQKEGLKCLDLIDILENEKDVFIDIGHFNKHGNEVIARSIYRYLLDNNLI